MTEKINAKTVIAYWRKSAQLNFETAEFLFKGKKYRDCLFFCHLTLEKTLKGLAVQHTKTHAPHVHSLDALSLKTGVVFSAEQTNNPKIISTFDIRARYDNEKMDFYKKCTEEYAQKYLAITQKLYLWLTEQYPKE